MNTYSSSRTDRRLQKGIELYQQGKLRKAEAVFFEILKRSPNDASATHLLGVIALETKRPERAVDLFKQAIAISGGVRAFYNNLGRALQDLGRPEEAVESFDKAIELDPNYANAYFNRGIALRALGRFDDALSSYDRAIDLNSHDAEAYNNRGLVLEDLSRLDEALASYSKAIFQNANFAEVHCNRGHVLKKLDRIAEALESYDRALQVNQDYAAAFFGRGVILANLKRFDEALRSYDRAIQIEPKYADAHYNRGNTLQKLSRFEEALQSYERVIQLRHDFAEAWFSAGSMYFELNCGSKAIAYLEKAIELAPNELKALFASCFAELPILYRTENEILECRETYERRLLHLRDELENRRLNGDLAISIAARTPFYLAYQGRCDVELQTHYGALVCKIMHSKYPTSSLPPPPAPSEPLRVGFVSAFFCNHSNWKIPLKGWMSQLDRQRFRIYGYHLGEENDAETDAAAALCDRFVRGLKTVDDGREEILVDAPHILVYPGLFMDSLSLQLAAQRLAPVQCNSWGHPETSGLPTLDYFISSDLMEPQDASRHYSEKLILLPNLSIYYAPPSSKKIAGNRADFGLRPDATIFWCGQSVFKYLPQFDCVFAEIAAQVEDCQLVFLRHVGSQKVTEHFTERLDRAFQQRNLNYTDHCVVLPRLNYDEFVGAIGQCDLILDSIGWSGCNSTLESLEFNLPIVTFQGSLMRGRHSAAILQRMDVLDTIATTMEEYVSIAVKLANDPGERAAVSRRIADNKHKLYRDRDCISAFEDFLDRAARSMS